MNEEALFAAALEKTTPAERRAFLDEACGPDANLRRRLDRLLAADNATHGILEGAPAVSPIGPSNSAPALAAGRVFADRFRLCAKLGEGGMGEVWVTEQTEPVRRRVALKVIRPGLDTEHLLARFEQERQALALMDHPNIAKVLDAGIDDAGRSYFAMELIDGVPITKYCDNARLSLQQRLELFVPVCHAVQHAHQKGIIHRDLKPSNILVGLYDGRPVPKVIDFGVAKATGPRLTERSVHTEVGWLIGTLEYMSPEQATLNNFDIDTRSDVYGLGAVLYELLTGSVPFSRQELQAAAFTDVLRLIREVDPPRPSTKLSGSVELAGVAAVRQTEPRKLLALVRGDLDWIVMKCLEKDRNRRYGTASGVARDIERYLIGEPVEACPPSAGYRLRKYAWKYRKALAAAGGFAVLLVAATVVSLSLASWAVREGRRAEARQREAETYLTGALGAVDQLLTRVADVKLVNVPQMDPLRRDLLQDALRFCQAFLKDNGNSPVIRSEVAVAYRRAGKIQHLLGQDTEAEESFRQAIAIGEQLLAESPDNPAVLDKLAGVQGERALFYKDKDRLPEAEKAYQQGVALREQLDRRDPAYPENRSTLAALHGALVGHYRIIGDLDRAEAACHKCEALIGDLLSRDAMNTRYLMILTGCHQNMALVYGAKDRFAEAEAAHQKTIELSQQLVRDQPDVVDYQKMLGRCYNNLGLLHARERHHAQAEAAYQQSLAIHEAIYRDHPQVVAYRVDVGICYGNMAMHVRRSRSPEESLPWADRAIAIVAPVLEKDPLNYSARSCLYDTHFGRGIALRELDRPAEAVSDWKRAIELSAGQADINVRLYRPPPLAYLGEHAQAASEMETLLAEGKVQPVNLYVFGYSYARCVGAAAGDTRLTSDERDQLAEQYACRAVEMLRRAQAAGYFRDPDRLARKKTNKDFNAISARPDFQKLLSDLEKAGKPKR
jgi:tetratricopeptide (TPR) repeat protein/tRNA A-37 threonylcarbamoyl transferase component Bud32